MLRLEKCLYYVYVYINVYIITLLLYCIVQSGPEKIAQSLMHCHFVTVCSRITRFSPKC